MSPSDPPVAAPTPPDVTKEEFIRQVKDEALRLQRAYKLSSAAALQEAFHRFEPFHSRVAAPTPETPSQWQPMETAPKDGRRILAWRDGGVHIVRWSEKHGYWDEWHYKVSTCRIEPTHWMPLPAPPLAGAVSHPQPEKKTTNDDEVARGDRRGPSAGFGTAGSDAGAQRDRTGTTEDEDMMCFLAAYHHAPDRATLLRCWPARTFDEVELLRAWKTVR